MLDWELKILWDLEWLILYKQYKRYFLFSNGELKRHNDNLVFFMTNGKKEYLPVYQVNSIYIFGECSLNKRVVALLNKYNIALFFYNFYGQQIGSLYPKLDRIGEMLISQVLAYNCETTKNIIANEILRASIYNMLQLVKYYNKKTYDLEYITKALKMEFDNISKSKNIKQSFLIEAHAKNIYYKTFDEVILNQNFAFINRSKNPPKNNINAMLSFGYSILYSTLENIIRESNLDISISFIHSPKRRKKALHFDLADIFKPIIIDRLVLKLINRNQINSTHFSYIEKVNGIYLNEDGKKIFLTEYDKSLDRTIYVARYKRHYSYYQILKKEVHNLTKYIINKDRYMPFKSRW